MAVESGLTNALYVAGYDLSSQAQSWNSSGPVATLDSTHLRQKANSRLLGTRTAMADVTSLFDPLGATHVLQAPLPTTDQLLTLPHDEVLGAASQSCVFKQIGYDPTRAAEGSLLFKVDGQGTESVLDWGVLATPGKRTDTGATNGGSVDFGAAGTNGFQAYAHVFAFTGTDCTISLQSSSDNGVGDAFSTVTGGSFTAVTTAPQWQKIYSARTQATERYWRVITSTSGGFTSITFAVQLTVNTAEVLI